LFGNSSDIDPMVERWFFDNRTGDPYRSDIADGEHFYSSLI